MFGSTSQLAMYTMGSLLFFSLLRIERFHLREGGGGGSGLVSMNGGYQKGEGCKAF